MPKLSEEPMKGYFPALDGLRGISILLVLLNHFTIPLPAFLEFFRARGHLGVEIFFAVSGFLVTRSLHICWVKSNHNLRAALKDFYIRRFSRILIPYLVILLLIYGMSYKVKSLSQKLTEISDITFSFFTYTYNYAKFYTEGQVPGALNIMWSLSFEEQFYLFLGLMFILFRNKFTLSLMLAGLLSVALRFFTVLGTDTATPNMVQFWTHIRLDAIVWGCLLYLNWEFLKDRAGKSRFASITILLGTLLAFLMGSSGYSLLTTAIAYSLTALFFTLIIFYVQTRPYSILNKLLCVPPLMLVGRVSYEIYLTHQIVNGFIIKMGFSDNRLIYALLLLSITLTVSWLFFRFINYPLQIFLRKKLI